MKKTLQTLVVSAFLTGVAFAGESAYDALDADKDGVISAKEAAANEALTGAWQDIDANADGVVDKTEFSAFETPKQEAK